MSTWDEEWKQRQSVTRDPDRLLFVVDQYASTALEWAEDEPERQKAAEIYAQVATAKAIAALAAAVLRLAPAAGGPNPTKR